MKIKKTLALALAGIMAVGMLSGCKGADEAVKEAKEKMTPNSDKVYSIGLCQLVEHPALDAATEGFMDALTEKLGDNVTFDLKKAAGEPTTCATIVNQFVASEVDLIFANATPALQSATSATYEIPIVGTSITDYQTALGADEWTGKTGINVTGTTDLAPLNEQAAMFKELLPDAKNIGILYCSGEANSKYQAEVIKKELEALGYTCNIHTFSDSNDLASVTQTACSENDALYIPTDNTAASNTGLIANVAGPANVPIIAGESGICKGCGIATLSIDYYSIGQIAGEMAYEILVEGKDPAEMEIRSAETFTKQFVADRAEACGVTIPEDYEAIEVE